MTSTLNIKKYLALVAVIALIISFTIFYQDDSNVIEQYYPSESISALNEQPQVISTDIENEKIGHPSL